MRGARAAVLGVLVVAAMLWSSVAEAQAPPPPAPSAATPPAAAPPAAAPPKASSWEAVVPGPAGTPAPAAAPSATPPTPAPNTTVIPRTGGAADPKGALAANVAQVKLVALLTADGQRIDQGIVWRVFQEKTKREEKNKLISTHREASPIVRLPAGDYVVNASFGRAHLTRKISLKAGASSTEQFVLNAGGMRLTALVGSTPAAANLVSYSVLTDERDQFGNRTVVIGGAKPGTIIRLNAGIYHIVSTYGDANATVRADVTVEAGKLTEATVTHTGSRITFKLVTRHGGEALPDTQWSLQTPQGEVVKESVGALPSHILAPGNYVAVARSGGKAFRREFTVNGQDAAQIEVLMQ